MNTTQTLTREGADLNTTQTLRREGADVNTIQALTRERPVIRKNDKWVKFRIQTGAHFSIFKKRHIQAILKAIARVNVLSNLDLVNFDYSPGKCY